MPIDYTSIFVTSPHYILYRHWNSSIKIGSVVDESPCGKYIFIVDESKWGELEKKGHIRQSDGEWYEKSAQLTDPAQYQVLQKKNQEEWELKQAAKGK